MPLAIAQPIGRRSCAAGPFGGVAMEPGARRCACRAHPFKTLREPSIDDLLTIVTESVQAYKVCQQRIEAVEKALSDTGAPSGNSPGLRAAAPVALVDDSDDIPF